jgi:hypothetical protein
MSTHDDGFARGGSPWAVDHTSRITFAQVRGLAGLPSPAVVRAMTESTS